MKATFNRIIVEPAVSSLSNVIHVEDRSVTGAGTIHSVGPMAGTRDEVQYHKFEFGQKVFYERAKAVHVLVDGKQMHLINDDMILGLL